MEDVVDDLRACRQLPSEGFDADVEYEGLTDTEEYITPSENGRCSTIEVYVNNGELIWKNGLD